MITPYLDAVRDALGGLLELLLRLALPLTILIGLALAAFTVILILGRDRGGLAQFNWSGLGRRALGWSGVGLAALVAWAALGAILPLARADAAWRESAEATANPVPDAEPVRQFGPAVGALTERTYTRRLTLPPYLVQRLGSEGIGVLAPYLSDPSAENVLRLADSFRRSGQDVVFTREVTRLDEDPIPFSNSQVQVKLQRLGGRAYDLTFEGRYTFHNPGTAPIKARFLFNLPEAGTIRELEVRVGDVPTPEPNESGSYEWTGELKPGEEREALVRYQVIGARAWHYDLGSRRRRVQQFGLAVASDGPVRFLRGSLQPTSTNGGVLRWNLGSVVTAQQIAIAFPPDIAGRESFLQALSALPVAFALFLIGVLVTGLWRRDGAIPARLALAAILFALGLAAAPVLTNYVGPALGVLAGSLLAAFFGTRALGRQTLLAALPAALVPAAFMSAEHTGLLLLLLAGATLFAAARMSNRAIPAPAPAQ